MIHRGLVAADVVRVLFFGMSWPLTYSVAIYIHDYRTLENKNRSLSPYFLCTMSFQHILIISLSNQFPFPLSPASTKHSSIFSMYLTILDI